MAEAKANGGFIAVIHGKEEVLQPEDVAELLNRTVKARGGTGAPTAADSAALKQALPTIVDSAMKAQMAQEPDSTAGPDSVPRHHPVPRYRASRWCLCGLRSVA